MSEDNKPQPSQLKNILTCGQTVVSIKKDMEITEYKPKTVVQLKEFVNKQPTAVLEEAQMHENSSKKESPDVNDVRLAHRSKTVLTSPLQEVLRECANKKKRFLSPLVKHSCELRLSSNECCVSSSNYALKRCKQKKPNLNCSDSSQESAVKRNPTEVNKLAIKISKPATNVTTTVPVTQKTLLEPKIPLQIARESAMKVSKSVNVSYVKRNPIEITKRLKTLPKPKTNVTATMPVTQKSTLKPKIPIQNAKQSAMKVLTELNVDYVKKDPIDVMKHPVLFPKLVTNVAATVPITQKRTLKPKVRIESARQSAIKVPTKLSVNYVKKDSIDVARHLLLIPKPVTNVTTTVPVTQKRTLKAKVPTISQKFKIVYRSKFH